MKIQLDATKKPSETEELVAPKPKNLGQKVLGQVKSGFMKLLTKENPRYQRDRRRCERYQRRILRQYECIEGVKQSGRNIEEGLAVMRTLHEICGSVKTRHGVTLLEGKLQLIDGMLKVMKSEVEKDEKLSNKYDKRKERLYFWQSDALPRPN